MVLSRMLCMAKGQTENAVERSPHLFALSYGIGAPPLSPDLSCVPGTEKGDVEPSFLVC